MVTVTTPNAAPFQQYGTRSGTVYVSNAQGQIINVNTNNNDLFDLCRQGCLSVPASQQDLIGLGITARTDPVIAKLLRAISRAIASGPLVAALASGVTLANTTSASANTTKHYQASDATAAGLVANATLTGGTPTLWGASKMAFPCITIAPSTTGGNLSSTTAGAIPALNAWVWTIDIETDSSEVDFQMLGNTTLGYRVLVDGQYVGSYEPTLYGVTGAGWLNLTFAGVRKPRRITVESQTATSIYTVSVLPTSNIRKYVAPDKILHIHPGDSYGEGQGATFTGLQSNGYYLGRRFGTADTRLFALGSTGVISARSLQGTATTTSGSASVNVSTYAGLSVLSPGQPWTGAGGFPPGTTILTTTGGTGAATLSQNATVTNASAVAFAAQGANALPAQVPLWFTVNTDITGPQVDLITIMHGYNDYSFAANGVITAAVTLALQEMRAACPNAVILFYAAQTGARNNDAGTLSVEAQIAAGVAAVGDSKMAYIPLSNLNPPLIYGTGYTGATTGVGNSDVMTAADGVHPTTLGHQLYAQYEAMAGYEAIRAMAF